jgi:uncharacterized protein YndB with AHSA1/START domain
MRVDADVFVARSRPEVFEYIARPELLPEYVTDFESVRQMSAGEPSAGTQYSYKLARRKIEGTFEWTEYEPHSRLAWHGPPIKSGPGSIEPAGWLSDEGAGTRVKLVMTPKRGGLLKLTAPIMLIGMLRGNAQAMQRLKHRLEGNPRPYQRRDHAGRRAR